MIEMQTVLIELLENFEFLPPPGNVEIIRAATGLMTPMYVIFYACFVWLLIYHDIDVLRVKDSKTRKSELPLTVVAL